MLHRLVEGALIRVFDVGADGQAVGDAADAHADRREQPGQVGRGRLALQVGVGGENNFGDRGFGGIGRREAAQEFLHLELFRPDAVHGAEMAVQDVVAAAEAAGALDGKDIQRLLDDADDAVIAAGVGADATGVGLGEVLTDGAEPNALFDVEQGGGQFLRFNFGRAEDVVGEALGRLGADAGQAVEGFDEPGEGHGGDGAAGVLAADRGGGIGAAGMMRRQVVGWGKGHRAQPRPGMSMPPVRLDMRSCCRVSSLSVASLTAAMKRSSTSS